MTLRHLPFYLVESAFVTAILCTGLFIGRNALDRLGLVVRIHWKASLAALIFIAAINVLFSEVVGPEFTLHYYLALWMFIGSCVFWALTYCYLRVHHVKLRMTSKRASRLTQDTATSF